jgi:hypothetical protein
MVSKQIITALTVLTILPVYVLIEIYGLYGYLFLCQSDYIDFLCSLLMEVGAVLVTS